MNKSSRADLERAHTILVAMLKAARAELSAHPAAPRLVQRVLDLEYVVRLLERQLHPENGESS